MAAEGGVPADDPFWRSRAIFYPLTKQRAISWAAEIASLVVAGKRGPKPIANCSGNRTVAEPGCGDLRGDRVRLGELGQFDPERLPQAAPTHLRDLHRAGVGHAFDPAKLEAAARDPAAQ